eukprot:702981-Hanusia_phi.AAC.3
MPETERIIQRKVQEAKAKRGLKSHCSPGQDQPANILQETFVPHYHNFADVKDSTGKRAHPCHGHLWPGREESQNPRTIYFCLIRAQDVARDVQVRAQLSTRTGSSP